MPKRTDIRSILLIGSGPIVIGQACAFDYSGTQACKALREEGFQVVLVNSNPATIMIDPEMADRTYIEPLTPEFVAKVIERERPQAMLPTVGGQTGLNLAVALAEDGTLDRFGVELIGAKLPAIRTAEDRNLFGAAMARIGLEMPKGFFATTAEEARAGVRVGRMGFPLIIRPSFTLGGTGASVAIIREIGVETGGSNIQFGINPADGRMVVIEMNPRVSRSSALASKATGFPIAKIAAKLAVGFTLDELRNDITRETPASFEPALDYCVVKVPRWAFEKFPEADQTLGTQMKSVGEAMAIGRTFKEALQKAVRSLEQDRWGLGLPVADLDELRAKLAVPNADRLFAIGEAYRRGLATGEIHALTAIDPWFLEQIREIVEFEPVICERALADPAVVRRAKRLGFADRRLADLTGQDEAGIRALRLDHGIRPTFKMVDTCAAEFVAHTPYLYSTYEEEDEAPPTPRPKVVILGSGPNRIGQGIEFDYCCVHAAFALRELGIEAIMVNCNPETVSTDYDTSDRLYFEPLTLEDVLNILDREKPLGVILQFGGQTPLKLAVPLTRAGVPILGTPPDAIDRAEDRQRFSALLRDLGMAQAPGATARSYEEAERIATAIGYPVLVRPSYVLGGRAMRIVYDEEDLQEYMREAVRVSPEHPVLVDKFLEDATEVDVDAIADGEAVVVGGVMEHIEKAGVHSGDAACALPPYSLGDDQIRALKLQTQALAAAIGVVCLISVQFV